VTRRDGGHRDKVFLANDEAVSQMPETLQSIQNTLLERAQAFREEHTREIQSADEFKTFFAQENDDKPEIHGGFALGHWGGSAEDEDVLQKKSKVTIRCIPLDAELRGDSGTCVITGKPAEGRVIFAKSY